MTFLQPGDTIKAFIEPLYGYCQPAWMFYRRRANERIRGHWIKNQKGQKNYRTHEEFTKEISQVFLTIFSAGSAKITHIK